MLVVRDGEFVNDIPMQRSNGSLIGDDAREIMMGIVVRMLEEELVSETDIYKGKR